MSLGDSWRISLDQSERTGLVTNGAYRVVRNPIFAAFLVAFLGLALMVPNPVALAGHRDHRDRNPGAGAPGRGAPPTPCPGAAYTDYASRVGVSCPGSAAYNPNVRTGVDHVARSRNRESGNPLGHSRIRPRSAPCTPHHTPREAKEVTRDDRQAIALPLR
ncbi:MULTISPECIES: methyltransferase family protein [Mycobacteriaceae]|uniref:methyltransferase family protein n=1 Tax=Mycobacteriaceae TaxID=1762 RepID=UPI00197BB4C2|nr:MULTISPECIES: isoprenylcysteine carboxylmethyltransferase family protein [Mycobacteriaceae]MDV3136709.1 hypothetical protein [Mycobacterium sp. 29Ha]